MIALIKSGKITGKICKELLPELLDKPLTGKLVAVISQASAYHNFTTIATPFALL
jgi:Asp-tRNA(Asn)/Glu-tRNA(Gln) amidotransferase B subunit